MELLPPSAPNFCEPYTTPGTITVMNEPPQRTSATDVAVGVFFGLVAYTIFAGTLFLVAWNKLN
jgi:hypothetical protein